MKRKYQILSILLISFIFFSMCTLRKSSAGNLFDIKDAFYQSWVISEKEKGTNINLEIINVKKGVVFDSIIFRGLRLPVFVEEKEGIVHLKSIINIEMSRIKLESKVTGKPDQLIYHYQDTQHSYILKKIRREKMKYF